MHLFALPPQMTFTSDVNAPHQQPDTLEPKDNAVKTQKLVAKIII